MFKLIIEALIDLLIIFFLLFLEHCFGMTFCHITLYMSTVVFGYYFGYIVLDRDLDI